MGIRAGVVVTGTEVLTGVTDRGTLQLEAPIGSTGFTVVDEQLTLNGPGFDVGAVPEDSSSIRPTSGAKVRASTTTPKA